MVHSNGWTEFYNRWEAQQQKWEFYFLSSRFNFKLKYLVYVNIVKILQKTFFFSWNKGIKDYFNWVMIDEYL